MSSPSQYLNSLGLDPLLLGLVAGSLLTLFVQFIVRSGKMKTNGFAADPFAAAPARPSPLSVSTKKSIHFRINLNGAEHSLTDEQTSAVIGAIKSGDREAAIGSVQSGLGVSPEVAGKIVDALAKAHLA
ncbi:MAG TPA: hypothetical protein VHD61_12485 [Lacunisphaera sp.]|nr:hypothetical protein [Lacunisphaera sp.]